ncbi:3'-5' exonuclease [Denitromonas iodatirespirans]|uniref:3'-5' exonuclease n=1 Tax=Denitromonas iodatirespirans TaxID=2795389 RepID=A0A944HCS9_DENI1|nr:3'-5' exonuclease [Denitromonas iodatirespirans]MBT0961451.1 3'-5' exonuclease [Denitromonas iodatirespirans]
MSWITRILPGARSTVDLAPEIRATLDAWRALPDMPLDTPHAETRYVVVNTEASGLDLAKDRLLAVAAIAIEGGLINPHHAYYRSLDPDPAAALAGLLEFIGKSPVVVFNAGFNKRILLNAFEERLGVDLELHWLDAYWLMPGLYSERGLGLAKLADWMAALRIETFQRHHALGDAYAIAQLVLAALARARTLGHRHPQALIELEHTRQQLQRSS